MSLLKSREQFLKRAAAQPVVENRSNEQQNKRARLSQASKKPAPSGTKNFALIAKIVNHMKARHLDGDPDALSLHEVLEECSSTNLVSSSTRSYLDEALRNNEKIRVLDGEPIKFAFKPAIGGIRNKKSFLEHMQRHSADGLGGVRKEAIIESLPKAEKILKYHEEKQNIYIHHRPDKKAVIFYNDRSCEIEMDEAFQKLWRSITVESVDEEKIAEYLNKQGMTFADDPGVRKMMHMGPKRRKPNKKRRFKQLNTHIEGLIDYTDK